MKARSVNKVDEGEYNWVRGTALELVHGHKCN